MWPTICRGEWLNHQPSTPEIRTDATAVVATISRIARGVSDVCMSASHQVGDEGGNAKQAADGGDERQYRGKSAVPCRLMRLGVEFPVIGIELLLFGQQLPVSVIARSMRAICSRRSKMESLRAQIQ
jgi:hypothetical protein